MKCPKCGYHSFETQDQCKKCGQDLGEHKTKYDIRGFAPALPAASPVDEPAGAEPEALASTAESEDIDFGFDFLEEDEPEKSAAIPEAENFERQDSPDEDLDLDQPFDIGGESLPADEASEQRRKQQDAEADSEF